MIEDEQQKDKRTLLESLELFRLPPAAPKKTTQQKKQEAMIAAQYRDFYRQSTEGEDGDTEMLTDEEREKRARERERAEVNRRKEQQLKRMDDMKKLMIQEMMWRGGAQQRFQGMGITQAEYYEQILYGDQDSKAGSGTEEDK